MQFAQAYDVRGGLPAVVEAVVGLGQTFIAADHQGGPMVVIGLARLFERRIVLETYREGEGRETVGWRIADPTANWRG